jgi:hypothetical protein
MITCLAIATFLLGLAQILTGLNVILHGKRIKKLEDKS